MRPDAGAHQEKYAAKLSAPHFFLFGIEVDDTVVTTESQT
jgi:hypothetical protein